MSRPSLREALGDPGPIIIDTSVLIAYLDGGEVISRAATVLLDQLVAGGSHPAVVSAVTVTECLVRPFRAGPSAVATAGTFLRHFSNLRVRPIDHEVATEAARVRAMTGLRTPDALVIATALVEGIATLVTGDGQWERAISGFEGLRVVQLRASLQE
jgi:predicted nucleic acid-binding protein